MSFIDEFYFEFEYRTHRTIKRDAKLRSGDAIVSRKETIHPFLGTMHTRALNQKISIGVGSSDPLGSHVFHPTKGPRPAENNRVESSDLRSKVPTLPSEVPSSFR